MNEFWRLSATELSALVRRREISARDVALDGLARLDRVNGAINAVVDVRVEETLAQADGVDRALEDGGADVPLAGATFTIKVNTDQIGFATTNGLTLQRNLVAASNNPAVDNLLKAGAVCLGRTNTPAFSYRWFTDNRLHGATRNPRNPRLTPGGSSGGAAAAVAAGIGAFAQGTDIAGSVRYPAYACGLHGIRPTPGRIPAWNASSPDRAIGPQLTAVVGPIGRTIEDLRSILAAMAAPDPRDPWWTPAPLVGPDVPRRAALCSAPDGLETASEVVAALEHAAVCLRDQGWEVERVDALPPLREAAEVQTRLWLCEGYDKLRAAAEEEGDAGALTVLRHHEASARAVDRDAYADLFKRRLAMIRAWNAFLERFPVVLMPVSTELPFADGLDLEGDAAFARVWEAQTTQLAIPVLGLPALTVSTGLVHGVPVGVQIVAGRFREDLCLAAGAAIEAGGVPVSPIDPVGYS